MTVTGVESGVSAGQATTVVRLPPIVAGRVMDGADVTHVVARVPGATIVTRYPCEQDRLAIEEANRDLRGELQQVSLRDVSLFLHRAGSAFLERIGEIGREYGEVIAAANGLDWKVVAADYELIGRWLTSRGDHFQLLRAELGSEYAMDEWRRIEQTRQRAVGRGLVFHSLVGNIPIAGLWSLARGLITRNANLLKLPSRDPLSTYLFARAAIEAAPDHPLARGISALYWPRQHAVGAGLAELADAACLWGSDEAIRVQRAALRPSVPVVAFGPRRSCAVLDLRGGDVDAADAARRMAVEASFYDQEACLSPLRAYVLGPVEEFEEALGERLADLADFVPRRVGGLDAEGHIRLTTEEARVRGWSVRTGEGWSTIVCPAQDAVFAHPLGRTVFIHPCQDLAETARWLDDDSQTVATYPYSSVDEVAQYVLAKGGSRVVELGMSRNPRRGFAHDGLRVLNSLVRWVSIEDDMADGSIYGTVDRDYLYRFFIELKATWSADRPAER
jgi:long-chain-fatty-acyl-CoA reductase